MSATTKGFSVTFSTLEGENSIHRMFPVFVFASDFEDAQDKAISLVESKNLKHGEILKIEKQ